MQTPKVVCLRPGNSPNAIILDIENTIYGELYFIRKNHSFCTFVYKLALTHLANFCLLLFSTSKIFSLFCTLEGNNAKWWVTAVWADILLIPIWFAIPLVEPLFFLSKVFLIFFKQDFVLTLLGLPVLTPPEIPPSLISFCSPSLIVERPTITCRCWWIWSGPIPSCDFRRTKLRRSWPFMGKGKKNLYRSKISKIGKMGIFLFHKTKQAR